MYRLRFSKWESIDIAFLSEYHKEYADAGVLTLFNLDTEQQYVNGDWVKGTDDNE